MGLFVCRKRIAMIWVFDLDNTLHDASYAIFPAITANMNAFIAGKAGLPGSPLSLQAADLLRLSYWRRYGATLVGMVRHHGVRQEVFLKASHDLGDLLPMIKSERGLAGLMRRLPGRKILLTNSACGYSREVLTHLGLRRHFDRHIAIESMRVNGQITPKPSRRLLRRLAASERVHPSACVMVEDSVSALRAARAVGMKTALVLRYTRRDRVPGQAGWQEKRGWQQNRPAFVNIAVQSVRALPFYLAKFR